MSLYLSVSLSVCMCVCVCLCVSIYGGRQHKADGAPVCVVGDKMGCGIEHRANGKRIVFFTHNSKSVSHTLLTYCCNNNDVCLCLSASVSVCHHHY